MKTWTAEMCERVNRRRRRAELIQRFLPHMSVLDVMEMMVTAEKNSRRF